MENKNELTATNLKNALWETLHSVKEGKMDAGQADSIASTAREIIRTSSLQLKIANQSARQVPTDLITFSEK